MEIFDNHEHKQLQRSTAGKPRQKRECCCNCQIYQGIIIIDIIIVIIIIKYLEAHQCHFCQRSAVRGAPCSKQMHACTHLYTNMYRYECQLTQPAVALRVHYAVEDLRYSPEKRNKEQLLFIFRSLMHRSVGFPADDSHVLKHILNVISWFKKQFDILSEYVCLSKALCFGFANRYTEGNVQKSNFVLHLAFCHAVVK